MRRIVLLLLLVTVSLNISLAAQADDGDSPAPVRLRVRQAGGRQPVVGTLARMAPDTLYLRSAEGELAIARSDVARIDVSRGMRSNAGRGFKIGLLAGTAVGFATGIAYVASPDACWCDPNAGTVAGVTAIIALPAAVLGAGIGALSHSERWRTLRTAGEPVSLYLAPKRGRAVVGLATTF